MSRPYHSRNALNGVRDSVPLMLFFGDLNALIGHIPRRPLRDMPQKVRDPILAFYHRWVNVTDWELGFEPFPFFREAVGKYYELIEQVGVFQQTENLCAIYFGILDKLQMGQQQVFHAEESIDKWEADKKANPEARYKAYMEKYHALHEGNVKYTFAMLSYCLDLMAKHKDLNRPFKKYLGDELSYKVKKLKDSGYTKLDLLATGIEPHLRNSIAHVSYEFTDETTVLFKDEDKKRETEWVEEMKFGTFKKWVLQLDINFWAQATALTLFAFDNQTAINGYLNSHPRETTKRELLEIIDSDLQDLGFEPIDTDIQPELIHCKIRKIPGFDGPSEIMGNVGHGHRIYKSRPALDLKRQVYTFVERVVVKTPPQKNLTISVLGYANKVYQRYRIDLPGMLRVMAGLEPKEKGMEYVAFEELAPENES